jgi:hypothetical protein
MVEAVCAKIFDDLLLDSKTRLENSRGAGCLSQPITRFPSCVAGFHTQSGDASAHSKAACRSAWRRYDEHMGRIRYEIALRNPRGADISPVTIKALVN